MRDLFRTPTADEAGGGPLHPDDAKAKGQTLRLTGQILALTGDLLPTPSVADAPRTNHKRDSDASATEDGPLEVVRGVRQATNAQAVCERATRRSGSVPAQEALLATVREHEVERDEECASLAGSETPEGRMREMRGDQLPACASQGQEPVERRSGEPDDAVRVMPFEAPLAGRQGETPRGDQTWGRFAPSVYRWERVLGRPAPAPTTPSVRGGRARLNPHFCEWMMGLPDGWVTNIPGIKYRNQMRILGNGVVPQQGAKAISDLLGDFIDEEKEA